MELTFVCSSYISSMNSEQGEKLHEVYPLALVKWGAVVVKGLHEQMTNALLYLIQKDREGETINSSLVKDVVDCYWELEELSKDAGGLSPYQHFENQYLNATERFYDKKATDFHAENSAMEYIKKVEQYIQEETKRAVVHLDNRSWPKVSKLCDKVWFHLMSIK